MINNLASEIKLYNASLIEIIEKIRETLDKKNISPEVCSVTSKKYLILLSRFQIWGW